jgi:regulatory protein
MIVTKINQQIKNPNRANIFLDGKYYFSLSLDQLLETKIKIGDVIDDNKLKILKKLSDNGKLKIRTLEWLMIRPRSEKELRDYLNKKKVDKDEIDGFVDYFIKRNYQNNTFFTKWWVEQRAQKCHSLSHMRFELKTKGIADELINEVLETSAIDEKQVLKDLIIKKRKLSKYQDDKKLTEYLLRHGFRYSLVKELLAE